jgi:hypothetical protein
MPEKIHVADEKKKEFVDAIVEMWNDGCFGECSASQMVNAILAGFDIGYEWATIKNKFTS